MKQEINPKDTCRAFASDSCNRYLHSWAAPLFILRPEVDLFVSEEVGRDFISRHQCHITIMPDGASVFWSMIPIAIVAAMATFAAVQEGHYIRTKQVF